MRAQLPTHIGIEIRRKCHIELPIDATTGAAAKRQDVNRRVIVDSDHFQQSRQHRVAIVVCIQVVNVIHLRRGIGGDAASIGECNQFVISRSISHSLTLSLSISTHKSLDIQTDFTYGVVSTSRLCSLPARARLSTTAAQNNSDGALRPRRAVMPLAPMTQVPSPYSSSVSSVRDGDCE